MEIKWNDEVNCLVRELVSQQQIEAQNKHDEINNLKHKQ